MKQEQTKFTLRVESELLRKFHHVAKCNLRSANKELEAIIIQYIEEYEKEHGKIK
ncbi:MAG: Arc family DNA-binding protein [Clostridiales bacterium]|nr:Arc family DNA-binding protein [Clostridiales bacterium]